MNLESLEQAVERELEEETGVHINYLEQLYTFGSPLRDPRERGSKVLADARDGGALTRPSGAHHPTTRAPVIR